MHPLALPVGIALGLYLLVMVGLGLRARDEVHSVEDFVLAGRRLGLGLATPTLLATWFGAGTLLAATDEVRTDGLRAAALDPLGAGVCLLLAGLWVARPLWRMGLLTLPDYYGRRYGPRAELAASWLMVPGYFGWIAAQFVALAAIGELYFGIPTHWGLPLVAAFGVVYTLLGGMWAVTLTDAVQMALVATGLVVLTVAVLGQLGGGDLFAGWTVLWTQTPPERQVWIPEGTEALAWTGLFAAGALGNLPGQDLTQRIFAARSDVVAQRACFLAGGAYLLLGMLPLVIGLASDLLLPDHIEEAILPALAGHLLHPAMAVLLVVTVVSAVLSTIDSAILAPATVLAHNIAGRWRDGERVSDHRIAVAGVAACALGVAWLGEDAYSLLEASYELGLVSLLVPLLGGLWWTRPGEGAALAAMGVGTALWVGHLLADTETFLGSPLPVGLASTALAALLFVACGAWRGARNSA